MRSLRITKNVRFLKTVRWQRVCGILVIAVPALLLSAKLLLAVNAAGGDLDPSFGLGGKVEGTPPPISIGGYHKMAIQAAGKIFIRGEKNLYCIGK